MNEAPLQILASILPYPPLVRHQLLAWVVVAWIGVIVKPAWRVRPIRREMLPFPLISFFWNRFDIPFVGGLLRQHWLKTQFLRCDHSTLFLIFLELFLLHVVALILITFSGGGSSDVMALLILKLKGQPLAKRCLKRLAIGLRSFRRGRGLALLLTGSALL